MFRPLASAICLFVLFAFQTALGADGVKNAFVRPGDTVVPQVATGSADQAAGGFFMTFQMFNITDAVASVQVDFFDQTGNPMTRIRPDWLRAGTEYSCRLRSYNCNV